MRCCRERLGSHLVAARAWLELAFCEVELLETQRTEGLVAHGGCHNCRKLTHSLSQRLRPCAHADLCGPSSLPCHRSSAHPLSHHRRLPLVRLGYHRTAHDCGLRMGLQTRSLAMGRCVCHYRRTGRSPARLYQERISAAWPRSERAGTQQVWLLAATTSH